MHGAPCVAEAVGGANQAEKAARHTLGGAYNSLCASVRGIRAASAATHAAVRTTGEAAIEPAARNFQASVHVRF